MLVVDRRKFWIGLIGLVTFFIILAMFLSPVVNGKTGLEYAYELFNQLAKNSSYYIPDQAKNAKKFEGKAVDVWVKVKDASEAEKLIYIVTATGAKTKVDGKKVKIKGDLGLLAKAALGVADALFKNQEEHIQARHWVGGREVVYYWWNIFKSLNEKYRREKLGSEANFTESVMTRALEPAYNFAGIKAAKFTEHAGVASFLLGFYVIYTIWYGFSIWYLFEGLGIEVKGGEKKEA
ncbi:MAG: hypothetical protein GX493_11835 [Firmicutes bacterium]|nr:hypothetical protein [Bacillota bacterium]